MKTYKMKGLGIWGAILNIGSAIFLLGGFKLFYELYNISIFSIIIFIVLAVIIGVCIWFAYIFVENVGYIIEIDENSITQKKGDKLKCKLKWDEVERISEQILLQRLVLHDKTGINRIYVDYQYENYSELKEAIFSNRSKKIGLLAAQRVFLRNSLKAMSPIYVMIIFFTVMFGAIFMMPGKVNVDFSQFLPPLYFIAVMFAFLIFNEERLNVRKAVVNNSDVEILYMFKKKTINFKDITHIGWLYENNSGGSRFPRLIIRTKAEEFKIKQIDKMPDLFTLLKKILQGGIAGKVICEKCGLINENPEERCKECTAMLNKTEE